MKDGSVAVKINFPESDFAGAIIYLEDWQARELKARVDKHNRVASVPGTSRGLHHGTCHPLCTL